MFFLLIADGLIDVYVQAGKGIKNRGYCSLEYDSVENAASAMVKLLADESTIFGYQIAEWTDQEGNQEKNEVSVPLAKCPTDRTKNQEMVKAGAGRLILKLSIRFFMCP